MNKTQIALFFCNGASQDIFLQMFYCNGTKDYTYFLVLNKSDSLSVIFHDYLEPLPIDTVAANLKVNPNLYLVTCRQRDSQLHQRPSY